ncbi:YIP1 family protein [Pseudohalioglobus lutimaris]|uniref:YIP1 family protein n=1 Tax=Pseudohalioglobus lutimaris TaxID=1737061 RepID=A0A2N5X7W4_9GAMM|nr:Yip1 family protein [Pseudohalioglobus lutimaris]PLW70577.1 YIP1 family protein [Pseudohalioglobus lutimaris]
MGDDTHQHTDSEENNTSASGSSGPGVASSPSASPPAKGFSLGTVVEDARRVCTDPSGFYSDMAKSGGYAEPAIFVAVMAAILGLLMTIFAMFGAGHLGAMAISVASIIIMPIFAVIGSFIAALVMFVIWKLMGSSQSYETAYRCIAYATAIYPIMGLLNIVPYVGTVIGVLWGVYLMYTASIKVHEIKAETARIVMGILAALMVFSQISGEIASRKIAAKAQQLEERLEKLGIPGDSARNNDGQSPETVGETLEAGLAELENIDQMTPEEAGEKLGAFFKKFEEGAKAFEKSYEESAEGTAEDSAEGGRE